MKIPDGTMVGRYQVLSYVDEGGMQKVYRAFDTVLERVVALKTPKSDGAERRFDRTARLSAQINQSNVARTLDYFDHNGVQYLIEEFVDGLDLGKMLKRVVQFDPYVAARIIHGIARGLAAVHSVDVVHRDLKPSNIIVVGGMNIQEVKVTDFGVSNMSKAEVDGGVAGGLLAITGSKTLIGHLPYLAPEILRKRKTVSTAADIWAAGALLYHFLAGVPPFGEELAEAVTQIISAPIPPLPAEVTSNRQFAVLGQELYGIVAACLQREPGARPTAVQLLELCDRLCYPVLEREIGRVSGFPGGSFGFADSSAGTVFFHVDSVFGKFMPSVGSEIWFTRHTGHPRDRAHPVIPLQPEGQ